MKTGRLRTTLFTLLAGTLMLFVVPWGFGALAAPGSTAVHSPITADTCGSGWVTANDAGSTSPFSLPGLSVTSGDTVVVWVAAIETGVFLGAPSAAGWTFTNALEWSVSAGQRGIAAWYGTAPATACVVFTISGSSGIGRTAIVEDIGHTLGLEASNNATSYGGGNSLPLSLTTGHTNDVIEAAAIAGSGTASGYSPGTQIGAGTSTYGEWMQSGYLSTGSAGSYTITANYASGGDEVYGAVVFEDAPAVSAGNLTITAMGRTTASFSWTNPPGTDNEVIWIYPSASAGAATCSGVQVTTSSVGVNTIGSVVGLSPGTNYSAEVQTQTAEGTAATGCIWFQTSQMPYAEYYDPVLVSSNGSWGIDGIGVGTVGVVPAPGNDMWLLYGHTAPIGGNEIGLFNVPAQTLTTYHLPASFNSTTGSDPQLSANGTHVYVSIFNYTTGDLQVVTLEDSGGSIVYVSNAIIPIAMGTLANYEYFATTVTASTYFVAYQNQNNGSTLVASYSLPSFGLQHKHNFPSFPCAGGGSYNCVYETDGLVCNYPGTMVADSANVTWTGFTCPNWYPGGSGGPGIQAPFLFTFNTTTLAIVQSFNPSLGQSTLPLIDPQYSYGVLLGWGEVGGIYAPYPTVRHVYSYSGGVQTLMAHTTWRGEVGPWGASPDAFFAINNVFVFTYFVGTPGNPPGGYGAEWVLSRDALTTNETFFLGNNTEYLASTGFTGNDRYLMLPLFAGTNNSLLVGVDVPPAPTGLGASGPASATVLSWTQAAGGGITANTLQFYTNATCSGTPLHSLYLSPAATSHAFTSLTSGAHYSFTVSAWNATGEGAYAPCFSFVASSNPPPAPTDLSVASLQTTSGVLTWVQSTGGGILNNTAFVWANSDCSGSPAFVYSTHGAATTYLDTNFSAQTTYSFEVASWNATGESPLSSCFPFTTPTGDPSLVFEDVTTNSFFEYWGNGTWLNVTGPVYIVFGLTQGAVQNASVSWPSRDNTNGILGVWSWVALATSGETANNSVVTYYYNASSMLNESFGPGWSVWIGLLVEVSHTTWFVFSVQLVIFSNVIPPPPASCPIICWLILVFVTAPLAATYLYFAIQRRWPWQAGYFYKVRRNPNWGRRGRM